MVKLGLRFDRRDAQLFRFLADRVRNGEFGPNASVNTFEQAALACESGEPLVVYCDDPKEVAQMAALYMMHGARQPVIEELTA